MEDASCDSPFMRAIIGIIVAAIQEKMHWVQAEKDIYLMMDNTGGQGSKETIREYKAQLKEKHDVVVHSQYLYPDLSLL